MLKSASQQEMLHCVRLDGRQTTMVFAWTDHMPVVVYHGDKISDKVDLHDLSAMHERPLPQAMLDQNNPISLHPELGRGFLGHPALIAHRPSVNDRPGWAGQFVMANTRDFDSGICFVLEDNDRGLELEISCNLDKETDVLTMQSRLFNATDSDVEVDWLAAPSVAPAQQMSQQLAFHGRWCAEFAIERQPIAMGLTKRENRRGRTSHEAFPGIVLLNEHTHEDGGPCIGVHLGWSGNHRMILERLSTGDVQLQMGTLLFSGEGKLSPGGSMQSPELYVAYSGDGLNAMSQKLHSHVRKHILNFPIPDKPRPVTVNTWEAIYFDHEREKVERLVRAAAAVGAERFVLDDGWFEGRNDDTTSLGDWIADKVKYPQGLQPLAELVRSHNMEFGLWVEPEMVSEDSDLFRTQPDWVLGVGNYQKITGRNQLVLDLTNPKVSKYLFERLAALISDHGIAYLKWDMNRDLVLPGDAVGRATAHRQTFSLYGLIDKLIAEFPELEIESCASGGGRVDYEILKRTHRFWTSDSNDAIERMRIQTGFSYFLPPEVMGAHIGPAWSHTSGRGIHPTLRALVAGHGHMGIEADLTTMSEQDTLIVKQAIEIHKQDREVWHSGTFRRIRTVDPSLIGVMAISKDLNSVRLVLVQLDRPRSTVPPRLNLPGLDPLKKYHVVVQTISEGVAAANRKFDNPIMKQDFWMTGDVLHHAGIGLPSLYAQTGITISLETREPNR